MTVTQSVLSLRYALYETHYILDASSLLYRKMSLDLKLQPCILGSCLLW